MKLKSKTVDRIIMIVSTVLFIALQIMIIMAERFGFSQYNGVIIGFQFGLCLIMVCRQHRTGIVISIILMSGSILFTLRALVFMQNLATLPGICNSLFYIVTMLLLAKQFRIRDKEAVTDFLTGLLNRRGLYRLLKKKVENGKPFHLVYVDLGNFKFINDNYGHRYGDILMQVVAKRMGDVVGKEGIITRIGGDEFVVVINGDHDARLMATRLLDTICKKAELVVDDSQVDCYLTAYAGIASYPDDSTQYEELIKYADIAMYQATKEKVDRICFFNKEIEQYLKRQMELEKLVKEGLEKDYFYLVYQPQYALPGKKLRGFESLIRMKLPDGTVVSPGEFIPVAEKSELILKIDDYVLRRALNEFKDVVREDNENITISVNVSAKNIGSLDFVDKIQRMLDETKFPPENLEIEITEYCLVQSMEITIENIKKLRDLGLQVALDDFGTGYTSLSYLARMSINLLKVDKSLVDNVEQSAKSRDFIQAVISMGHLMGCEVILEGVENNKQLSVLEAQGCDFIQGYVWGRPMEYVDAKVLAQNSH